MAERHFGISNFEGVSKLPVAVWRCEPGTAVGETVRVKLISSGGGSSGEACVLEIDGAIEGSGSGDSEWSVEEPPFFLLILFPCKFDAGELEATATGNVGHGELGSGIPRDSLVIAIDESGPAFDSKGELRLGRNFGEAKHNVSLRS